MLRRNDGSRAALILLQQAYQEYLRALQNLDKAQHYFDLGLIGSGGGTPKQKEALDIAKGNYDVAVAQYNDALRAYNRLVNGVPADDLAAAQAQVDAAQSVLDQTRLVAPFNGTILEVDILPGDMVNPGTVAVVVADLSELHVDVPIAEVDFNSIAVGQPAQLTLDAVPNATYIGSVTQISLHATVSGGSVSYPIRVVFTNPDGLVVPGMTVAVNIEVKHLENVLLVPNRAVRSSGGSLFIYVLRNGSLVSVAVQLGESNGTESQVTGGDLNVGDQIVLNPPTSLLGSFGPGSSNSGGGGGFGSLRSMGALGGRPCTTPSLN
jgi:HlyD family secretion protein